MNKTQFLQSLTPPQTPPFLIGGNAETLYAKFLQGKAPAYRRELLPDSTDTERVAYDFLDANNPDAPLIMLFHGLEGSSSSHYAVAIMNAAHAAGFHAVVAHFRSCGGVASQRFYHSGDSPEIAHMLQLMAARYRVIDAVGVSLGGNALAKYLGECGLAGKPAIPRAAAVISAPIDLPAAGRALQRGLPYLLYTPYFLHTLLKKVPPAPHKIRSLAAFDNAYTAPLHGFADKDDYYRRAMCKPFLPHIHTPTLLLNAQNDPFLPARFLPSAAEVSEQVYLFQPQTGGHVGFVSGKGRGDLNWLPQTVLCFFAHIAEHNR
ncbi:MAG: alpha/beta hydrolase [Neisseria sp.]|nr:alpha/beta hydrolase [Neisseria sp.]